MATYDSTALSALLPGYEIGGVIGEGGWGVVWRARHLALDREVAIKQLSTPMADPDSMQRFAREARLLAAMQHPHVVAVHDFVARQGVMAIVMDLLAGGNARQWSLMTEPSPAEVCGVGLAAAAGLAHAHSRGIIHRDVKPANLLFDQDGTPKLVDFGMGRADSGAASQLTAPGTVLGSPAYLAPEQAIDAAVTPAADVYALATTLFELLALRLPFEGGFSIADEIDLLTRRVSEDAPALAEVAPQVPAGIGAVIDQGLARRPAARFADAHTFGHALFHAADESFGVGWLAGIDRPLHFDELAQPPHGPAPSGPAPSGSARSVELLVAAPGHPVRSLMLTGPVTVGREGVEVVLDDPETSRRHATLEPLDGAIAVRDLASSNGTFVNGRRLEPRGEARLAPGGWLDIGATRIVLAAAPPPTWLER